MTLFGRLFEARGLNDQTVPLSEASVIDWMVGEPLESGVRVTEHTANRMAAVYRAVSLIAGTCAATPLRVHNRLGDRSAIRSPLLENPCPGMSPYEFWELSYIRQLTYGNFYADKVRDGMGVIRSLTPIDPANVTVRANPSYATVTNPLGKTFQIAGRDKVALPSDVLHVPALGYDGLIGASPIRIAAQGIGIGLSAEKYQAKQFSSGALMAGILHTDQRINEAQADEMASRWRQKTSGMQRAHDIVVMGSGAEFQPIQFPNQDLQMMEIRRFQVDEIARIFGVPPYLLGAIEKSTSWGTGLEQQSTAFVKYTLRSWLTRTQERISQELLTTDEIAEYDTRDLMRGDSAQRTAYYTAMWNLGAYNADEIRSDEGLNPLPDGQGQKYITPLNVAAVESTPPAPAAPEGAPDATAA